MTPQKLPFDPITEGDEWPGIPALSVRITPEGGVAAPPASALTRVTMRLRKDNDIPSVVIELDSATAGEITIVSAANWEISIPPQIIAGLTSGVWRWRLKFYDSTADGSPKTYLADTWKILETI